MINLLQVNDNNINDVKTFLSHVPSIEVIDESILKNAIIALDNDKIIGSIAYEAYNKMGLIRYFVFKKILPKEIICDLFSKLESVANTNGITKIISIVSDKQIEDLFLSLGFIDMDKTNLYLDEEEIKNTAFANSNFMQKCVLC